MSPPGIEPANSSSLKSTFICGNHVQLGGLNSDLYYGIKLSIFCNFGIKFSHTLSQANLFYSEQNSILALASHAFIHKMHKSCVCLIHSLFKN